MVLWFILTLQSEGENELINIQSLVYFHFFEALNDVFEVCAFSRVLNILHHITDTSYVHMQCRS